MISIDNVLPKPVPLHNHVMYKKKENVFFEAEIVKVYG
jgi:hypothetical protein